MTHFKNIKKLYLNFYYINDEIEQKLKKITEGNLILDVTNINLSPSYFVEIFCITTGIHLVSLPCHDLGTGEKGV